MKSPYVCDLQPNQVITSIFLVHVKDIRQKKSGEPYLSLLLGDRTGELEAKMWDNVIEVLESFNRDDFIKVKGLLQIYQHRPQLTIHKMVKVLDSDVDFADYFPCSERNADEMFAELRGIIAGIGNIHLRQLLDCFMDDQAIARMYRIAPAAKSVHHAFLSGLIEHVLSMCRLAKLMAAHYKNIDLDLLLAGAILHDIGKLAELTYDRSFGYSVEGQLLGHIVIGLRMLGERLQRFPDFPPRLRVMLEHMIVSHHGELEYGSPKVPLFPEALLLHHLDNLDSKMECMRATIARDRHADGCWTAYNPSLERAVLKKLRYLDDQAPEAAPAPTPPPAPKPEKSMSLFGEKLQQVWQK
ncbi:MAG: 3'-5' exoribonuclease YhaM family protein [Bryobacteraceae bacterium]